MSRHVPSLSVPKAQYDATRGHRRLKSWSPSGEAINGILALHGNDLVCRARDLTRNNPYVANGREAYAAAAIGTGIKPSSLVRDALDRAEIQAAWLEFTDECDADDQSDFYGQQALAAGAMFDAGDAFFRFRDRRMSDGLSVPLQVQQLEAEQLPWSLNIQTNNNTIIRMGIEFNRLGKRLAYWFWRRHPNDSTLPHFDPDLYTRVPASEVVHLYRPLRAGQIRGVPAVAPAMVRLHMLDSLDDNELERKRVASLYAGFITQDSPDGGPVPEDTDRDDDETPLAPLEPGTLQKLLPGEDVKFSDPADVGNSYEPFQYRNLCAIAAGIGIPYYILSGDLKAANYSSLRAGLVEFRRRIEQIQHAVFVYQLNRRVWARWMDAAVMSGRLSLDNYTALRRRWLAAKWITPAWPWVDPLKDRQAEKLAVEQGWKSRSDVIEASEGYDPEEVDARIKADQDREDALGLRLGPRGDLAPDVPMPQQEERVSE